MVKNKNSGNYSIVECSESEIYEIYFHIVPLLASHEAYKTVIILKTVFDSYSSIQLLFE